MHHIRHNKQSISAKLSKTGGIIVILGFILFVSYLISVIYANKHNNRAYGRSNFANISNRRPPCLSTQIQLINYTTIMLDTRPNDVQLQIILFELMQNNLKPKQLATIKQQLTALNKKH